MRQAGFKTMLGIACVTMAVLASEITLTRLFSVTLMYHFAFLVVSLALLGSGAAGVWLYLAATRLTLERAPKLLPWLALGYALTNVAAFFIYQQIPLTVENLRDGLSARDVFWLAFMYIDLTIPYIFAGATVALALRYYQAQAGKLYFADLLGASLGCLTSVLALNLFGAAGAMTFAVFLSVVGAFLLALEDETRLTRLVTGAAVIAGALGLFAQVSGDPVLTIKYRHTYSGYTPVYEGWNAFSRISLYEDPWPVPFGWGISRQYYADGPHGDPGHLMVLIDEKAGTPIQRHEWNNGDENWAAVDFLAYDVTALPYALHQNAEVFVIGPGGGRDVLTGLLFGAKRIVGVELNNLIYDLVKYRYPDYAGHIYSRPNVEIHVDDARTFLAAHDDQFDIIQASLIDTFASTSAGAFALSENGIYTVEAFEDYYDHLHDGGMVNFSRWYYAGGPAETLRLVSVALKSWENQGVADPTQHLVVLANLIPDRIVEEGLAGMLLKKTPFTEEELQGVAAEAERLNFGILYAPGLVESTANPIAEFVLAADRQAYIDAYPLDISPATDNRPFFFNVVRLGDLNRPQFARSAIYIYGVEAMRTLLVTLGITLLLALVLIVLPLFVRGDGALKNHRGGTFIGYYAMLGLGFILVEIPMIQKLSIYMGNPTYALVVILFSLLLFSGIGSFMSQRIKPENIVVNVRYTLLGIVVLVCLYALLLPYILKATQALPVASRALVAVVALMPAGLLMGRPFPLGLRYIDSVGAGSLMPWLWAANGTLSVVGSVLATLMAINLGFMAVFLIGSLAYAAAYGLTFRFGGALQPVVEVEVAAPAIIPTHPT